MNETQLQQLEEAWRRSGDSQGQEDVADATQPSAPVATGAQSIAVVISPGEYFDREVILEIKAVETGDPYTHILRRAWLAYCPVLPAPDTTVRQVFNAEMHRLRQLHTTLWRIEDTIRLYEFRGQFDDEFIRLVRQVPQLNDMRARIKSRINGLFGIKEQERKIYPLTERAQLPRKDS